MESSHPEPPPLRTENDLKYIGWSFPQAQHRSLSNKIVERRAPFKDGLPSSSCVSEARRTDAFGTLLLQ